MTKDKIIDLAKKQVGVHESPMGSKNVKYNNAYYGGRVNNPALAWCVVFLWWLFRECGMSKLFYQGKKTASCETLYRFYKNKGQIKGKPEVGDIVFYDWNGNNSPDHVGLVVEVKSNGSVVAIEGNTSASNQSNGGYVQKKTRAKSYCMGFARIAYKQEEHPQAKPSAKVQFVKDVQAAIGAKVDGIAGQDTLSKTVTISATKNSKHKVVKPIQEYLNHLGYDCGTADGIAGAKFTKAVKKYQFDKKCVQDGEITAKGSTWKKLLGMK